MATVWPAATSKLKSFEDLPRRLVSEGNVLEADSAGADLQRRRAGPVFDLGRRDSSENRFSMSITACLISRYTMPMKFSGVIKLDHHGVDHDEIADGIGAALDAVGAQHHGAAKPEVKITACPALSTASDT